MQLEVLQIVIQLNPSGVCYSLAYIAVMTSETIESSELRSGEFLHQHKRGFRKELKRLPRTKNNEIRTSNKARDVLYI